MFGAARLLSAAAYSRSQMWRRCKAKLDVGFPNIYLTYGNRLITPVFAMDVRSLILLIVVTLAKDCCLHRLGHMIDRLCHC
jgi:hypothetical protein